MPKDCSTCKKLCCEHGPEDNSQYCRDGIDLNELPEDDEKFECPNYKKGKVSIMYF